MNRSQLLLGNELANLFAVPVVKIRNEHLVYRPSNLESTSRVLLNPWSH